MELLKFIVVQLTSPLTLSLLLVTIGFLLGFWGNKKLKKLCHAVALLWFFIWSQTYFSNLLLYPLEHLHHHNAPPTPPDYIHVLACYYNASSNVAEISKWSECSLQRNVEAYRIYRQTGAKIVVTGGMFLSQGNVSYAQKAAEFLYSLGVPEEDIVIIANGKNTVEEVEMVKVTLSHSSLWVISSATHMLRLSITYANHIPHVKFFPVDFHSNGTLTPFVELPSLSALRNSQHAFYEYFALAKLYLFEDYANTL